MRRLQPTRTARALSLTLALLLPGALLAAVRTERIQYQDGDQVLYGFLSYDDRPCPRPASTGSDATCA
jgi:hypothetical protein